MYFYYIFQYCPKLRMFTIIPSAITLSSASWTYPLLWEENLKNKLTKDRIWCPVPPAAQCCLLLPSGAWCWTGESDVACWGPVGMPAVLWCPLVSGGAHYCLVPKGAPCTMVPATHCSPGAHCPQMSLAHSWPLPDGIQWPVEMPSGTHCSGVPTSAHKYFPTTIDTFC